MFRFIIFFIFISCSGYQIRENSNPFKSNGVRSIAVPMFVNNTNRSEISGAYTKEVISILKSYSGLKVRAGDIENEDAVLIGMINSSQDDSKDPITYRTSKILNAKQKDAIGDRTVFSIPTVNKFSMVVTVVLLKKPKQRDVDFYIKYFKFPKSKFPGEVFRESFSVSGAYGVDNTVGDDDTSANVRGARNRGSASYSLIKGAEGFGVKFKGFVDNVF